jgi:signal transduction histidine kinase
MGLSIVAKLVERWGGTLTVESAPGQGSQFEIQLPAAGTPVVGT